ncbi:MAG: helix-turn-helix transcriptional regulator [Betaproteobacteria bacterium]|nr:helix-turn-helix transcriptional regulator [Betaproteobacteria bacterium]
MDKPALTPKDIGLIVRATRIAQGIRAQDLAGIASPRFLTGLEAGKPTAQLGKVLDVLEGLGIRVYLDIPDDVQLPANLTEIQGKRISR